MAYLALGSDGGARPTRQGASASNSSGEKGRLCTSPVSLAAATKSTMDWATESLPNSSATEVSPSCSDTDSGHAFELSLAVLVREPSFQTRVWPSNGTWNHLEHVPVTTGDESTRLAATQASADVGAAVTQSVGIAHEPSAAGAAQPVDSRWPITRSISGSISWNAASASSGVASQVRS